MSDWKEKLKNVVGNNVSKRVRLTYEDNASVFLHLDNEYDTAINDTTTFSRLSNLVSLPPFTSRGACNIIDEFREGGHMKGYLRGSGEFTEFVETKLKENSLALENGWVEIEIEKYDYKRGRAIVRATVDTTAETCLAAYIMTLEGWKISTMTDNGLITIDC